MSKVNSPATQTVIDEDFYQICRSNSEMKFERNANGKIITVSPTGGETGIRNFNIIWQFGNWNNQYKLGYCFDSSTCFKLPNNAYRSPDLAFISKERWESLQEQDRDKFPPLAPDFVLELMSPSDSLKDTQAKMEEYLRNGVKLGWLIDRKNCQVEVYRLGKDKQLLIRPTSLSNADILPNFVLNLESIW